MFPASLAGKSRTASRRPSRSSTTATCTSLCVSTPTTRPSATSITDPPDQLLKEPQQPGQDTHDARAGNAPIGSLGHAEAGAGTGRQINAKAPGQPNYESGPDRELTPQPAATSTRRHQYWTECRISRIQDQGGTATRRRWPGVSAALRLRGHARHTPSRSCESPQISTAHPPRRPDACSWTLSPDRV